MNPGHNHHQRNPIVVVLVAIPVLLVLGAMKGCQMIDHAVRLEPPATVQTIKPAADRPARKVGDWGV